VRNAEGKVIYYEGCVEDITARKEAAAELQRLNGKLVEASRTAGMAEVATGVLHNVGNVLNSVSVSAQLLQDQLKRSKFSSLQQGIALMTENRPKLGAFLTDDPKGKLLPDFLTKVTQHVAGEHERWHEELRQLEANIEHMKQVVAMQQDYARVSDVSEPLVAAELVEDALRMNLAGLERHRVHVERDYQDVPLVIVDKHKVLQILINLIRNAKYALDDGTSPEKRLKLQIYMNGSGRVKVLVSDNGVGIPQENLTRIFQHGFTTRRDGHGFGLHSGAIAAKELGGDLFAHSDGPGLGATFTLELPVAGGKN
jgi:C4-dicarboxylate-specific signal transduction histidine kinase